MRTPIKHKHIREEAETQRSQKINMEGNRYIFVVHLLGSQGQYLVIGSPEPASDILVIKHLHFKCEVFLHIFDDHHQKRQLDPESAPRISRASYIVGTHICAHDFQNTGLDVLIGTPLDMSILNCTRQNHANQTCKMFGDNINATTLKLVRQVNGPACKDELVYVKVATNSAKTWEM